MASNSASVNVSSRSSSSPHSNQKATLESSNSFVESALKREFPVTNPLSNKYQSENETLYRIEPVGQQVHGGGLFGREQLNKNSSSYVYGNYWQVSLPVYSMASFEAQQLMQMDLQGTTLVATSRQGNEAYSSTKNFFEDALASPNEGNSVVEENQVSLSINIIA